MAIIEFDNGSRVDFDGTPTQEDVEEVANRLGLSGQKQPARADGILKRAVSGIGNLAQQRATQFDIGLQAQKSRQQTRLETGVQLAGQSIGLGEDIALKGLGQVTPSFIKSPIEKGISAISQTRPVQNVIGKLQELSQKHPRASRDIDAIINIASLIPIGKGVEVSGRLAEQGLEKVSPKLIEGAGRVGEKVTEKLEKKAIQDAIDITSPVINKKGRIAAFERAGKAGGVSEEGLTRKFVRAPTGRDLDVAQTAKGLVSKSNSPIRNLSNIAGEIERVSEQEVTPFLGANPNPANINQFRARLKKIPKPISFKADPVLNKLYDSVIDTAVDTAAKSPKNSLGFWQSRIEFDKTIEREFGDIFDKDRVSAINKAVLDARTEWNNFIADRTPDRTFKKQMQKLNNLYRARFNVAEQNQSLLNSDIFTRFKKTHPRIYTGIKYGAISGVGIEAYHLFAP